jgi:hypothetical protein
VRALTILLALAFALPAAADAGDAVEFFPQAYAWTQARHELSELRIVCTRPREGAFLSLLADGSGKVVLAAASRKPPRDPEALLHGGPDSTRDWTWLWDRNRDGAVDYLAFSLGSAMVYLGELPAGFARGKSPTLSSAHLEFALRHIRGTFYHAADDNFDGTADLAVYPLYDAETWMWVKGFFALRSTHFDGRVDEDWAFAADPAVRTGPAPRNERGYRRDRRGGARGVDGLVRPDQHARQRLRPG